MYTFSLLLLIFLAVFKPLFSTSSVFTIQTFRFFACRNNHSSTHFLFLAHLLGNVLLLTDFYQCRLK